MSDLVTVAEVTAAWADFANLDASEQSSLIEAASRYVTDYTRRNFLRTTYTEVLSGTGHKDLRLANYPILSVTSVTIDGVAETDYVMLPEEGILVRGDADDDPRGSIGWDRGTRNITVVYIGGEIHVPEPVKRATILMAKEIQQRTDAGTFRREKIGDYEYETGGQEAGLYGRVPSVVSMLLAPYCSWRMA
jgi:hypothetical protein